MSQRKFVLDYTTFTNPELFITYEKKKPSVSIRKILSAPLRLVVYKDLYAYILFFVGLTAIFISISRLVELI